MPVMPVIDFDQRSAVSTMEEITTKRPHFRLRLDLSKFFHDARRFCWIFIDGTKIHQVIHMQQHISKLFTITEPFHLLLNETEYLPPIEDIRILKENETISVVPGFGINNDVSTVIEISNDFTHSKKSQTTNAKTEKREMVVQDTFNDTFNNNMQPTPISNITTDMTYYSIINDTVISPSEGDTDNSKTTDNNITEDCNLLDSLAQVTKRKRVRKRKPRNRTQILDQSQVVIPNVSPETNEEKPKEPKLKKPKIIDSYIIPSGKHIRFDIENENHIAKQIVQESSKNESCLSKGSSSRDLSTLLALGHSSTPITFVNKKLKNVKKDNTLNEDIKIKNLNKIMEDSAEKKSCIKESKKEVQTIYLQDALEKLPVMTRKPQLDEIIALKTLKIGADYTPQVSNSILTKVVEMEESSGNYTLQILSGKEEVQVPFGKFALSDDESENHLHGNKLMLNYSHMIEPRLIPSIP
ncbi:uncharacterized protein LOC105203746 [Solenopsis invicta]|uniref:uncharacterized protein LOC105203746 n=1 Tax=Solenopsis invicta TaxID=13686 RepID=UPI000595967A|nr:uncharacterized protein LOC105203746 [Solenopsis invicta]